MIAIIDYNAGNVTSVKNALERLGEQVIITSNAEQIQSAEKVIFPGVGEAKSAMEELKKRQLDTLIPELKQPFLGICIGQQLMCTHSQERDTDCLGIFDTEVVKFKDVPKVPHMGWNRVIGQGKLFEGIEKEYFYFVHSYYVPQVANAIGTCQYEALTFSAAMQKNNFHSVQFHPEKSAEVGERLLHNFLNI